MPAAVVRPAAVSAVDDGVEVEYELQMREMIWYHRRVRGL